MAASQSIAEPSLPLQPFDRAQWPVHLALITWAALAAGISCALGGFDDPRLSHNGWVRLATIGATLLLLFAAVRVVRPHRAQRIKLAVVVSLIAHTLLLAVLHRQRLAVRADEVSPVEVVVVEPPQVYELTEFVIDIAATAPDRPEFERPVASPSPVLEPPQAAPQSLPLDLPTALHIPIPKPATPARVAPRTVSLERRRDVLADHASALDERSRRQAVAALPNVVHTASPREEQRERPHPPPHPEMLERQPTPNVYVEVKTTLPDLPDRKPTLHLPPSRRVDPLPTLALELSRARSERLVDTALPPEIPAETKPAAALPKRGRESFSPNIVSSAPTPPSENNSRPLFAAARVTPIRLPSRRTGAEPVAPSRQRQTAAAYAHRQDAAFDDRSQPSGGLPPAQSDATIQLGLEFLARSQLDDGRWSFGRLPHHLDAAANEPIGVQADAAATGLALLAFLGAGYDHFDGRYKYAVEGGLDYLQRIQSADGMLFPEGQQLTGQVTRFYSHGIAALALCEAYGMTGDPQLRAAAQAALDYLIETQHPELGGWRYVPGINADLSVTGWQVMALRSGDLAGLHVPADAYAGVRAVLDRCRDADSMLYCYNPWASATDPRVQHGRRPSTVMTAVGLLLDLHLRDDDRSTPRVRQAVDHLLANSPQPGEPVAIAPTGTLANPGRDTYYWYYATQAMFHLGGSDWHSWNDQLQPLLVESQTTTGPLAGSWDPRHPVPDKWASYGGRLYLTAMNLLSLEVGYRYLPLYESSTPRIATGEK